MKQGRGYEELCIFHEANPTLCVINDGFSPFYYVASSRYTIISSQTHIIDHTLRHYPGDGANIWHSSKLPLIICSVISLWLRYQNRLLHIYKIMFFTVPDINIAHISWMDVSHLVNRMYITHKPRCMIICSWLINIDTTPVLMFSSWMF